MKKRIDMGKTFPEAYKTMDAFDKLIANVSVNKWHLEMIRIKASIINGCAYCVDCHSQDAQKLDINPRKISLITSWREAGDVFDVYEQNILLLTEEVTLIHQKGISDDVYNKCIDLFGEKQTAELIMAIITINAWNRIGVGLKMKPNLNIDEPEN